MSNGSRTYARHNPSPVQSEGETKTAISDAITHATIGQRQARSKPCARARPVRCVTSNVPTTNIQIRTSSRVDGKPAILKRTRYVIDKSGRPNASQRSTERMDGEVIAGSGLACAFFLPSSSDSPNSAGPTRMSSFSVCLSLVSHAIAVRSVMVVDHSLTTLSQQSSLKVRSHPLFLRDVNRCRRG